MDSLARGKIVDWDQTTGRGLVDMDGRRLFLNANDFLDRHRAPAVGDEISFLLGEGDTGGFAVRNARFTRDVGRLTVGHFILLVLLLVAPGIALFRLAGGVNSALLVAGGWLVLSLATYLVYSVDKRRARANARRISESSLHLCALLGGWPGAFLAQRRLRHKSSKIWFQCVFWLIVVSYQLVAVDYLLGWQIWDSVRLILRPKG